MAGKDSHIISFVVKPLAPAANRLFMSLAICGFIAALVWLVNILEMFTFIFLMANIFMLAAILILMVLSFGYEGVDVDLKNRTWRTYTGFLGMKNGEHTPIPENLNYVLIFEGDFSISVPVYNKQWGGPDVVLEEYTFYEVSVVFNSASKQVFMLSSSKQEVIKTAELLKEMFLVPIHVSVKDE